MTLEEEVVQLRAELVEARQVIAQLRVELEQLRSEKTGSTPFIKPNSAKSKNKSDKQLRRKRAKDH